jgi:predicted site-specific integrase-resolvase
MSKKLNWLPEKEAAEKLNYQPRTLRRLVKSGTLNISFTSLRGRNYFYDEVSIEKVLSKTARIVA